MTKQEQRLRKSMRTQLDLMELKTNELNKESKHYDRIKHKIVVSRKILFLSIKELDLLNIELKVMADRVKIIKENTEVIVKCQKAIKRLNKKWQTLKDNKAKEVK